MAASQTTRLAVYTWTAGTDTFTRDQMTTSHNNIEARVAGYNQAASRPAASTAYKGFVHYSSTDSSAGTLSYCNGVAWFNIGNLGSTTPTELDHQAGSAGSAQDAARSDHKHAIGNDAITNAMIATDAVQSDQIQAAAVTNAKLASSGLDAGKLTTGTLPAARIANDSIAHAKLANSAGFTVLGKGTTGGGSFTELTAGNNGVLRRSGSGDLEFGTLVTANIGSGQITTALLDQTDGSEAVTTDTIRANNVTVAEIEQVAAHGILANATGSTANLTEVTASSANTVLQRGASGSLQFNTVTNDMLAGGIAGSKIASNDIGAAQLGPDCVQDSELDYDQVKVYSNSTDGKAGYRIFKATTAPTSGTYAEGDIWLEYTS